MTWGTFYWVSFNCSMYFNMQKMSRPLFSKHFPCPRSRLPVSPQFGFSLYVNHTAVMDDFMELTSDLTEKLLRSESWREIEMLIEKWNSTTLEEASTGWHRLPSFHSQSKWHLTHKTQEDEVYHRYQLTELSVFPVSWDVFCKFCSYTADRSMLWFAFSREVGTPSGTSYF